MCLKQLISLKKYTDIFAHFYFHKPILKTIIRNNCVYQYLTGRCEITVHCDMMPCHVVYGSQPWHETPYPPNRLSPFIKLHGVRSPKAVIVLLTTVIIIQGDKIFSMIRMWNILRTYLHWSIQIYVFCHSYDVREISMWNKIILADSWLEVIIRKVLRPATSTQVFLGFPMSISKCWGGSQDSKLPLHASHVALPT